MDFGKIIKPKDFENYVVVPATVFRDTKISLGAIGLYCYLLSHKSDFNLTLEFLANAFTNKISSIRERIKELEKNGYLERIRVTNKKGHLVGYDYLVKIPTLENPKVEKPYIGKSLHRENQTQSNINNKIIDTKSINNKKSNNNASASQKSVSYSKIVTDAFPHFRDLFIGAIIPKNKSQEATWLNALQFLERNGYNLRDCYAAIKWARQDPFWEPNVLSLPPLTKAKGGVRKLDNILAKYKAVQKDQSRPEAMQKLKYAEWTVKPNALGELELYALSKGEVINEFIMHQSLGITKDEIKKIKEYLNSN